MHPFLNLNVESNVMGIGVWTKAIQRRTDLPQKVIAKSIKILEQQALIKPVKSVKVRPYHYWRNQTYRRFVVSYSKDVHALSFDALRRSYWWCLVYGQRIRHGIRKDPFGPHLRIHR